MRSSRTITQHLQTSVRNFANISFQNQTPLMWIYQEVAPHLQARMEVQHAWVNIVAKCDQLMRKTEACYHPLIYELLIVQAMSLAPRIAKRPKSSLSYI